MQRCLSIFGRLLFTDSLRQWPGVVNYPTFRGKLNIRCFCQVIKNAKGPNGISGKKNITLNDLFQDISIGKGFSLKQLTNVFRTIEFEKLKTDEAEILLKYCGSVVADSSRKQRNMVCQDIFKGLQRVNNLNTRICNRYIKTCTENSIPIQKNEILAKFEPDKDTYKLLLENACHFGNIEDAFEVLELLKNKQIPLESDSINNLILAHTLKGGLKSAETVLTTIRTAQVSENNSVKLALFKGLVRQKNLKEFNKAIEDYPLSLTEHELLDLIEELGLNGLESWLNKIRHFYKHIPITRDLQNKIERICIHLIHMKQPNAAINIYETFIEPHPDIAFGFTLLKEMLHCNVDITAIISTAKSLVEKELNPYVLESLTELALKFKYEKQTWALLKSLEIVRPHYFWPLFIHYGSIQGENGVFSTLQHIKEFKVKLEAETLENYILPYCDLSNLNLLILKLRKTDFTMREILSPLLTVLLKQRKTRKASELCRLYDVDISGEGFVRLLARSWAFTKDSQSVLILLARYCESNRLEQDIVGIFLTHAAKFFKPKEDFQEYLNLLKLIRKNRLRISTHSADVLQDVCKKFTDTELQKELETNIHSLLDFGLIMSEEAVIPHPKTMDLGGLECHLTELKEKNMETRGVLRRLIQMYASTGNIQRVTELRQLFSESGYDESAGMKSSIMHCYVTSGHLEEAMSLYKELIINSDFHLDSFKFIDLVNLLIDNDRFEEGYGILQDELSKCKTFGNIRSIERNCRELLSVCKNEEQVDTIFKLLIQSGLCRISNVMLGPLVRIHLKSGDIDKAVEKYIELSKKHKCTPLQFEVMSIVAQQKKSDQLEKILRATEAVHGAGAAQVGLVAALAENGQENALKNTLMNCTSPIQKLMEQRCKRWVEERKIEPLQCLANACDRLHVLNVDFIYTCILDIYDLNSDFEGAWNFFNIISEDLRSSTLELRLEKMRDKNKISCNNLKMTNSL